MEHSLRGMKSIQLSVIFSVPILESQQKKVDYMIRSKIPKITFEKDFKRLSKEDRKLVLPDTIPASVKALRMALETPASFWRISRYTKNVSEYQELIRQLKGRKKDNLKIDMTDSNHKWDKVENESLFKLMHAIDEKVAGIDKKLSDYRNN